MKPTKKPAECSEARTTQEADPRKRPDGTKLPTSKSDFHKTFPRPSPTTLKAAVDYMKWVTQPGSKETGPELLRGTLDRGDALLEAAGHWLPAVEALRYAWEVKLDRGHTAEMLKPEWEGQMADDLLQFLRTQVTDGALVRQDMTGTERVRAKPHSTSAQNPSAILDKL